MRICMYVHITLFKTFHIFLYEVYSEYYNFIFKLEMSTLKGF